MNEITNFILTIKYVPGEELVREGSAEYEYALAAQVGRQFRNPRFCELRYQVILINIKYFNT